MKFSAKQQEVFDEIMHFFLESDEMVYIFSGVAGSGKSTIINEINNLLRKEYKKTIAVITLTGKAVSTLKEKGIANARTIHSYMYVPLLDEKENLIGFEPIDPNELLEDFIIMDEGSMATAEIIEDAFSLGKKILIVGDENQLPSISADNFNVMDESNFRLEEIHRLASDNPIIQLSQHILEYGSIPKKFESEYIRFVKRTEMKRHLDKHSDEYEIVLCGMNKTRHLLNRIIRKINGHDTELPDIGERVICLRNDKMQGIFNGEMFTVQNSWPYKHYIKQVKQELSKFVMKGDDGIYSSVLIHNDVWGGDDVWLKHIFEKDQEGDYKKRLLNLFDFGSAVTVWKSQGSEYNNLMFVDEDVSFFVDRSKFRYTGITRSKDKITIVV